MTFTANEKYINVLINTYITKLWNPASDGYGLLQAMNMEKNFKLKNKFNVLYNLLIQNNMDEYGKLYNDCKKENKEKFNVHLNYVIFGFYRTRTIYLYIKTYADGNDYIDPKHSSFVNKMLDKSTSLLNFVIKEFIPKYAKDCNFNFNTKIIDTIPLDENKYNMMSYDELSETSIKFTNINKMLALNPDIYRNNKIENEFMNNLRIICYVENKLTELDNANSLSMSSLVKNLKSYLGFYDKSN